MTEPTFIQVENTSNNWFEYGIVIRAWHDNAFMGSIVFKGSFPYHPDVEAYCNAIIRDYDLQQITPSTKSINSSAWAGYKKPTPFGEFRILGVTAEEWNALPAGARYNLIANADDRSLRLETNGEG